MLHNEVHVPGLNDLSGLLCLSSALQDLVASTRARLSYELRSVASNRVKVCVRLHG